MTMIDLFVFGLQGLRGVLRGGRCQQLRQFGDATL